jgi:rod shape-determining protein MreB and related proteins
MTRLFSNPFYVRVRKNRLRVRSLESAKEATFDAQPPFTSARLLVGEFQIAEGLLRRAFKEMTRGIFAVSPQVLIQPLEMIEGGLSEVETRCLRELALGAGASKAVVWTGAELSDAQVREKLDGK